MAMLNSARCLHPWAASENLQVFTSDKTIAGENKKAGKGVNFLDTKPLLEFTLLGSLPVIKGK